MMPTQIQPESSGTVKLASADPHESPVIDPEYLRADSDIRALLKRVKLARDIADTDIVRSHCSPEVHPGPDVTSEEGIREFVRNHASTVSYSVGTCKVGDNEMAVVGNQLRVRGVDGLRVVNASVMPRIVGGNTNAPTIAIVEKSVDLLTG